MPPAGLEHSYLQLIWNCKDYASLSVCKNVFAFAHALQMLSPHWVCWNLSSGSCIPDAMYAGVSCHVCPGFDSHLFLWLILDFSCFLLSTCVLPPSLDCAKASSLCPVLARFHVRCSTPTKVSLKALWNPIVCGSLLRNGPPCIIPLTLKFESLKVLFPSPGLLAKASHWQAHLSYVYTFHY